MTAAIALLGGFWLLAGLAGGIVHFGLLRWNTALYVTGGMAHALAVQMLRLAATTALLAFAAWHGTWPLLLAALGVVLARWLVLRWDTVAP